MFPFAQTDKNGLRICLHVQPGASKTEIAGIFGDALKLRVAAKAEDGAANKAVCAFLAKAFSVPKTSVSILRGASSRHKIVMIVGNATDLMHALENMVNF